MVTMIMTMMCDPCLCQGGAELSSAGLAEEHGGAAARAGHPGQSSVKCFVANGFYSYSFLFCTCANPRLH